MGNKIIQQMVKMYNATIAKHPFIRFILVLLSGCWSIIIKYHGISLHLATETNLTKFGWISTIIIVAIPIAFTTVEAYYIKNAKDLDYEKTQRHNSLLLCLNEAFYKLCESKSNHLFKQMINSNTERFIEGADPAAQLELLCEQLRVTLSEVLSEQKHRIKKDEIGVDIFYKLNIEGNGEWRKIDVHGGITNEQLLSPTSTFSHLINGSRPLVLYNSKATAANEGHYIPESNDENIGREMKGSIFGYKFSDQKDGDKYIEAAIFAATYTKPFLADEVATEENINNMSYNLSDSILPYFQKRALIELEILYLKKVGEILRDKSSEGV